MNLLIINQIKIFSKKLTNLTFLKIDINDVRIKLCMNNSVNYQCRTLSRRPFSRKDVFPKRLAYIMITLPKVFRENVHSGKWLSGKRTVTVNYKYDRNIRSSKLDLTYRSFRQSKLHNFGPEEMRRANSKFLVSYLYIVLVWYNN